MNTDNLVRTATGFQEFVHNGKHSLCENTDKKDIKVYLRRKKKE